MDLYNNDLPAFTTWVIENDLLQEPFVVIDVGVQGGPHPRWKHLKDKVRIYGFDAIPEVVEGLNARKQPNETYFATSLGDEEGTRDFYVRGNGSSYYGSSLYEMPSDAFQPRVRSKVPITRLDTLFAKGVIPPADHIKVDCEGHDPEVIRGASQYLAQIERAVRHYRDGFYRFSAISQISFRGDQRHSYCPPTLRIRPRSHAHSPAQLRRRQGPASLAHCGPDERCS